jgi:3-oxoacyl-[acyl-carrier protein] reductase
MGKMLKNRNCIVTGSGRGVGRASALMLAKHDARVVVNDLDDALAAEVVNEIKKMGGQAISVNGDICAEDFPRRLIKEAVAAFGPDIDVIVNNAGFSWHSPAHKITDDQWDTLQNVLVRAPFRIIREAAPYMRDNAKKEIKQFGVAKCRKIINISSLAGMEAGNTGMVNYSTAKAAIIGMTRALAKEWGPFNIGVNAVALGMIDTRLTVAAQQKIVAGEDQQVPIGMTEIVRKAYLDAVPMGRPGTPEDVAKVIFFLASDLSDYVTDEVIRVSGGQIVPYIKLV